VLYLNKRSYVSLSCYYSSIYFVVGERTRILSRGGGEGGGGE
jgi:hypothetical protein